MNQERWQQVKQILDSALGMPPNQRDLFIKEAAGGDSSLCNEVKSFIAYQSTAADFMQSPAIAIASQTFANGFSRNLDGKKLGHYQILERIGSGGMGEVYLAKDLALGRQAAIKVLPPHVPEGVLSRLTQEAEAAVKLQHPGIATFYESGIDSNVEYIAMEFVAGETLRARISRGPLSVNATISLAIGLLEALAHAHSAGILHRDIKPENIMFTHKDVPKLLDFGLAVQLSFSDSDETQSAVCSVIAGTLGYMSPEQVRGDVDLDARSDLFSLGVVLYEALSGQPAFPGSTPADRLAAVLYKNPPPLDSLGFSPGISNLIQRSLEKSKVSRFPSAASFLREMQALSDVPIQAGIANTLAIMDFRNLSNDSADDWLGTGLAESLMADLARLPGLKIASRDRIARASLSPVSEIPDSVSVAQSLGCRWVLDGNFQRLESKIQITARLTEVATHRIAATEKIDGALAQLFGMQDRLSSSVAKTLQIQAPSSAGAAGRPILTAYEHYNRGRQFFLGYKKGGFERAASSYQEAIAIDPRYALAYAGLASIHAMKWTFTTDPADFDAAKRNANRAIELDPSLGEPRVWLGYVLFRSGQPEEALEKEGKARELEPSNYMAFYFEGLVLKEMGRMDAAISSLQESVKINPQFPGAWTILGGVYMVLDKFTEALWCLQHAFQLETSTKVGPGSGSYLAEVYRRMGNIKDGKAACLETLDFIESSDAMLRDHARAVCLNTLGRCALSEGDLPAASAAFHQAIAQIRGRSKSQGAGYVMAQALAGAAQAGSNSELLDEAFRVFQDRNGWNFSAASGNLEGDVAVDLGIAAAALGRIAEAQNWSDYARQRVVSRFRLGELEKMIDMKNSGARNQQTE